MQHSTWPSVAVRALAVAAFSAGIAVALTLTGPSALDVNLVYSLGIGVTSWLCIDVGRLWLSRNQEIPWPHGLHGMAGWLLVVAGTAIGFVTGMALGNIYAGQQWHSMLFLGDDGTPKPLIITMAASIAISFFHYSRGKARFLQARIAQAQRDAAEARLKLLETQLEPHMMFNTLANLRVLIATDAPRAQAMLDHLIDYLRATLGASRATLHPLADEFARLADYLELMAVRMGPRLAFTLDLPAGLRSLPVPPLVLQPLVENAIRHGLEPQVAGGHITVSARLRQPGSGAGAAVQLTVADTGVGLAQPGGLVAAAPAHAPARHFGLQQVRERLSALYGAQGTLDLIAGSAGGTSATITFPMESPQHERPGPPACPDR